MSVIHQGQMIIGGGIISRDLTLAEYNALSEEEQKNGVYYNIIDDDDGSNYIQLTPQTLTDEQKSQVRSNIGVNYIHDINTFKQAILDVIYPVGSVAIFWNTIDPNTQFGGIWVKIEDRFLLGSGSSYSELGALGGEATHKLEISELPSHAHRSRIGAYGYNGWDSYTATTYGVAININSGGNYFYPNQSMNLASVDGYADTGSTGGGNSHNNMPPYVVVNLWKRTE